MPFPPPPEPACTVTAFPAGVTVGEATRASAVNFAESTGGAADDDVAAASTPGAGAPPALTVTAAGAAAALAVPLASMNDAKVEFETPSAAAVGLTPSAISVIAPGAAEAVACVSYQRKFGIRSMFTYIGADSFRRRLSWLGFKLGRRLSCRSGSTQGLRWNRHCCWRFCRFGLRWRCWSRRCWSRRRLGSCWCSSSLLSLSCQLDYLRRELLPIGFLYNSRSDIDESCTSAAALRSSYLTLTYWRSASGKLIRDFSCDVVAGRTLASHAWHGAWHWCQLVCKITCDVAGVDVARSCGSCRSLYLSAWSGSSSLSLRSRLCRGSWRLTKCLVLCPSSRAKACDLVGKSRADIACVDVSCANTRPVSCSDLIGKVGADVACVNVAGTGRSEPLTLRLRLTLTQLLTCSLTLSLTDTLALRAGIQKRAHI